MGAEALSQCVASGMFSMCLTLGLLCGTPHEGTHVTGIPGSQSSIHTARWGNTCKAEVEWKKEKSLGCAIVLLPARR